MRGLYTLLLAAACAAPTVAAQDARSFERQNLASLRQMIATVNAGDAAGYAKLYGDNATITIYGGEKISGRDAIEKYEIGLMRQFPGTRLAFYEVWQQSPIAIVRYGVNGKTAGGAAMGHEGLLFFRFGRSGLIAEERRYLDSATPMAQLGAFGKVESRSLPQLPADLTAYALQSSVANDGNVQVVRLALQAIEANDFNAFMRHAAPAMTVDDLMLPAPFNESGILRWFMTWANVEPGPYFRVTNTFAGNDYVILETAMSGWLKGPVGRLAASPKPFSGVHTAWIAQLKDGAIVKLTRFLNMKELADATGQSLAPK